MKIVLATTSSFAEDSPELLKIMAANGLRVVLNPHRCRLSESELDQLLKEHMPIGLLAGTEKICRAHLEQASEHLRVISRVGVGWENIDREAAADLGILIYRTPDVLTQAVAELTIGLILSGLRSITYHDRMVRQDRWQKKMGSLLQGKEVGIIGFGSIGRRVGELVNAFGARVIYYDPRPSNVSWATAVPLHSLLKTADVISIHADGNEMVVGSAEFKCITKQNVILVNTARGSLVDEEALYQCLSEGRLGCACLDVYNNEPYDGPLRHLENIVLTPHIGSYALEARRLMEQSAVENLLAGLIKSGVL
ncbi:hydroxyacid dehydrogenase [bacterium]|nr:MAG: hydroxyacid dehydrogenase [bacterium]